MGPGIFGLVWVVALLVRAIRARGQGRGAFWSRPIASGDSLYSALASGLGLFFLLLGGFVLFLGFAESDTTLLGFGVTLGAPGAFVLCTWLVTQLAWIPLGAARFAFGTMKLHGGLGDPTGAAKGRDRQGTAALCAALATMRKKARSEDDLSRLEKMLRSVGALGGASLVGRGLLAVMRDDVRTARASFAAALEYPTDRLPRLAYVVASNWRAADRAARGEWGELATYGHVRAHGSKPFVFFCRVLFHAARAAYRRDEPRLRALGLDASRGRLRTFIAAVATARADLRLHRLDRVCAFAQRFRLDRATPAGARFLAYVALRLVRAPGAPSDRALRWAWRLTPNPRGGRALLHRALAVPVVPVDAKRTLKTPSEADPWDGALATIRRLVATPVGEERLYLARWISDGFDAAFDRERLPALIARRGAALEVAPTAAIETTQRSASRLLADLAAQRRVPCGVVAGRGSVSQHAAELLRERSIEDVVSLAKALGDRVDARALLHAHEEAAAFGEIAEAVRKLGLLGGEHALMLTWERVRRPLWGFAIVALGEARERPLGHAVFRWLLDHARVVGDDANAAILERNVAVAMR